MSKIVIVTGVGRGLGLTIAQELLHANYQVIGVSRTRTDEVNAIENENFRFITYDFSQLEGIYDLSNEIKRIAKDDFGGSVYGLVNNAAIGTDGVLGTMHASDISKILTVNVEAPILLTKYISRQMLVKLIKGRIINVGSIIGSTGYSGLSVYGASKAAMEGFTRSLARELGKRSITVNVIAPGFMETHMTSVLGEDNLDKIRRRSALGAFASTKSVADMVIHLLSPSAGLITGTVITVDGGSTA